jgi:hypothetical protein
MNGKGNSKSVILQPLKMYTFLPQLVTSSQIVWENNIKEDHRLARRDGKSKEQIGGKQEGIQIMNNSI